MTLKFADYDDEPKDRFVEMCGSNNFILNVNTTKISIMGEDVKVVA